MFNFHRTFTDNKYGAHVYTFVLLINMFSLYSTLQNGLTKADFYFSYSMYGYK